MRATDLEDTEVEVGEARWIRPLGALEHIFWLIDQQRPMHFAVAAEIAGALTPVDWRRALYRMQLRHPVLAARIVGSRGRRPWLHRTPGPIPLRTVEAGGKPWEAVVSEELATPFDPDTASLFRAVVVNCDNGCTLILVAHHAIADGMSLAYLVRDVLRAVDAVAIEVLPILPSQDDLLVCAEAHVPTGLEAPAAEDPGPAAIFRDKDGAHPVVEARRLGPELTERIRERARQEASSVHGALCAAIAIAGRQSSRNWRTIPLRFLSPVDTRPILGVGEDCGLFVGAAAVVLEARTTAFWDIARHATATARAGKSQPALQALVGATGNFVAARPSVEMACEFAANAFAREAMVTNLGELPIETGYGGLQLRALWGPIVLSGFVDEHTIGTSTLGGSLCLTYASQTPFAAFLAAIELELIKACPG